MPKKYFIVLDTETANDVEQPLVYDVGFTICDRHGNIYERHSYVIYDVYVLMKDLMETAYYHKKLPIYEYGLKHGLFKMVNLMTLRRIIYQKIKEYNIKDVGAFNGYFDLILALNKTLRYITKSKYRYFFPYGVKFFCIWHMATQTICLQKTYQEWTRAHGYVSPKGNIRTDAETIYRYYHETSFKESHTGLDDAIIETFIFAKAIAQHKPMQRRIYRACWRIPNTAELKLIYDYGVEQLTFY